MVDGIFSILDADSFTFLSALPRPSQNGKHWRKYEIGITFSRTMYGPFVLNTNFWDIPYFPLDFTYLITTTRSTASNSLMSLPLLRSSMCLSLLLDTRMLNNYICLNIIGDAASKWSNACFPYEVHFLNLAGDRSIGTGKSLPIATTDKAMSVLSIGPAFQAYSVNNTPLQPLVKAALVHWVYLLYLVQVTMKPFIFNLLVVPPCNCMYWD